LKKAVSMGKTIRVGSRESALALAQSRLAIKTIKERFAEYDFEIIPMKTSGDLIQDRSLDSFGGKGLFVKELDQALLDGRIDMAAHSLKDLPVCPEPGIRIAAYSGREDHRDVLVLPKGVACQDWAASLGKPGTKPAGCSGQRRRLQLGRLFPGLGVEHIRGNVPTRLEKLDRGDYGALVLAAAGLKRLGLEDRISRYFEDDEMLCAPGQGIMAVTVREDAEADFLSALDDPESRAAAEAERSFVRTLEGNCAAPIAAHAVLAGDRLVLAGMYCPGDYGATAWGSIAGAVGDAAELGASLAWRLRSESKTLALRPRGKVFLVGAGPGDPGLLTLKGDRVLRSAEVVLYDNLVGRGILSRIPQSAEAIYVGKRSGNHALSQNAIAALLITKAREGKRVARLKGGDPFLFGRGGEELEGLRAAGIPFEVVPGVSSAFAAPAYSGIPLTHRDHCSSVHIVTGHGGDSVDRDIDYHALVQAGGTLVLLMGLSSLEEICGNLVKAGLDPETPGAVISRGTTARQRRVLSPLSKLPGAVREAGLESPAIIVIGAVCAFAEQFSWTAALPLAGLRIGVARPRDRAGRLSAMLAAEGAEVVELPSIRTVPVDDNSDAAGALKNALTGPHDRDWFAFTSPFGVQVFFEKLRGQRRDIRSLGGARFAALGSATAAALEERGIIPDLVPEHYSGEALGKALGRAVKPGERVIFPRSRIGSDGAIRPLEEAGIDFLDSPLYDTLPEPYGATPEGAVYRDMLCEDLDWVIFTSASTVAGFVAAFGAAFGAEKALGPKALGPKALGLKALCIGARTAAAAEKQGMKIVVAEKATLESMVERLRIEAGKEALQW
jgi:uroporphyrinogen III methyltransferase/synthase